MLIIYSIAVCKPRLYFHAVVELEQTLSDTITHGIPSTILIGNGINDTIRIHLASKGKYFLTCLICVCRTVASLCSASGQHQKCRQSQADTFLILHILSFLVHSSVSALRSTREKTLVLPSSNIQKSRICIRLSPTLNKRILCALILC